MDKTKESKLRRKIKNMPQSLQQEMEKLFPLETSEWTRLTKAGYRTYALGQRDGWLSRQTEIDQLKAQIGQPPSTLEVITAHFDEKNAIAKIGELTRQVEQLRLTLDDTLVTINGGTVKWAVVPKNFLSDTEIEAHYMLGRFQSHSGRSDDDIVVKVLS